MFTEVINRVKIGSFSSRLLYNLTSFRKWRSCPSLTSRETASLRHSNTSFTLQNLACRQEVTQRKQEAQRTVNTKRTWLQLLLTKQLINNHRNGHWAVHNVTRQRQTYNFSVSIVDSWVQQTAAPPLSLLDGCSSAPAPSDRRGWSSELRPKRHSLWPGSLQHA